MAIQMLKYLLYLLLCRAFRRVALIIKPTNAFTENFTLKTFKIPARCFDLRIILR